MTINSWGSDEPVQEVNGGTSFSTVATGEILYASNTDDLAKLTPGNNGDVLTVATDVPSWAAPASGGGSWVFLAEATANNSASISFDNTVITSTYDAYMLIIANLGMVNQSQVALRFSPDNGTTIRSSGYNGRVFDHKSSSTSGTTAEIRLNREDYENAAGDSDGISWVRISKPTSATDKTTADVWTGYKANDGNEVGRAIGCYDSDEAHNYFQLSGLSGNLANGLFLLYGLETP